MYWQDIPGQPGYWAVLKHADVVHVAREPLLFSASEGGIMLEDARARAAGADAQHAPGDGPAAPRRLPPAAGAQLQGQGHRRPRGPRPGDLPEIFERVGDGEVEFVHDVTSGLPSQVVGELVGIPEEDWPKIHRWSEMSTSSQDPDFTADGDEVVDPVMAMAMYAIEFAGRRRQEEPRPTSPR